MTGSERVHTLETEVAVINSKLDEIQNEFKQLTSWMHRHEKEHEKIREEREEIRDEIRANRAVLAEKIYALERDNAAYFGRQNLINTILATLGGAAVSALITFWVAGAFGN